MYGTTHCPNCGHNSTIIILGIAHDNLPRSLDCRDIASPDYEPLLSPEWFRPIKREAEKARRIARERSHEAIRAARLDTTPPLPERLYHRPRRTGRAVGSRHRVMLG